MKMLPSFLNRFLIALQLNSLENRFYDFVDIGQAFMPRLNVAKMLHIMRLTRHRFVYRCGDQALLKIMMFSAVYTKNLINGSAIQIAVLRFIIAVL